MHKREEKPGNSITFSETIKHQQHTSLAPELQCFNAVINPLSAINALI